MSTIKVDEIFGDLPTDAVDLPNKFKVGGTPVEQGYTASGTEPSSASNGDYWWDTGNEKLYRYMDGGFKEIGLPVVAQLLWAGDRGVFAGGQESNGETNRIQYINITSTGNTTDFGNLTAAKEFGSGASNASRGLYFAGYTTTAINNIDYVTISTPGNAQDFGDLQHVNYMKGSACSDGIKAFIFGGYSPPNVLNNIQQVTIGTTGNSTDFGDLSTYSYLNAACGDATRGVCALGRQRTSSSSGSFSYINNIEYITTANTGNSTDFGDATVAKGQYSGCSDTTRGIFVGGIMQNGTRLDEIDYITIQTTGNATDFGNLSQNNIRPAACANSTRGVIGGGFTTTGSSVRVNTIEYVTIQTPGNVTDFGDLAAINYGLAAFSGNAS